MQEYILMTDSTCDLPQSYYEERGIVCVPFPYSLDGTPYLDDFGQSLPYAQFYAQMRQGSMPTTSTINTLMYDETFSPHLKAGKDILYLCFSSALSSSYRNCCLAAKNLGGHVHPVDSHSLSTGTALQVMDCRARIDNGEDAASIADYFSKSTRKYHASFILDTLEFLHAGGRCSAVAAFGANLLKLKPCIEVDNTSGGMGVGKKYRGKLENVLIQYTEEKLSQYSDVRTDKIFITHSGIAPEYIQAVRKAVEKKMHFDNIYITQASCTISSHCGPNTLGILFATESEEK